MGCFIVNSVYVACHVCWLYSRAGDLVSSLTAVHQTGSKWTYLSAPNSQDIYQTKNFNPAAGRQMMTREDLRCWWKQRRVEQNKQMPLQLCLQLSSSNRSLVPAQIKPHVIISEWYVHKVPGRCHTSLIFLILFPVALVPSLSQSRK